MRVVCNCGHKLSLVLWASPGRAAVQFTDEVPGSPSFGQVVLNCPGCRLRLDVGLALLQGKAGPAVGQGRGSWS